MAIKPIKEKQLNELQLKHQYFWTLFNELSLKDDAFSLNFKVHPYASIRGYQDYSIGYGFHIVLKINIAKSEFHVGCYFEDLVLYSEYYSKHKDSIEKEIGTKLKWDEYTTKGSAYLIKTAQFDDEAGRISACLEMISLSVKMKLIFEQHLEN